MKIPKYTEDQKEFILKNHGNIDRKDMAKRLNVNCNYVTAWAIELTGEKRVMNRKNRIPEVKKDGYFYHEDLATI